MTQRDGDMFELVDEPQHNAVIRVVGVGGGGGNAVEHMVTSHVEGVDSAEQTLSIDAPANIELLNGFEDIVFAEDATREATGIEVKYFDQAPSATLITVTGDNIVATINGHSSGSTFDIAAAEGFYGTTEVTVVVADADFPSDSASATFTLTAEGTAPVVTPTVEPETNSSSGGSMTYLIVMLSALVGLRRRLSLVQK